MSLLLGTGIANVVEVFDNNPSSTLSANVGVSDTVIFITTGSNFSSTGNFRILVDNEYMLVTGVFGNQFVVQRGIEGSTAATHSTNATVTQIVTAGAMQAVQQYQVAPVSYSRHSFAQQVSPLIYTIDTTGGSSDYLILHRTTSIVSYVMPTPTDGRHIVVKDCTGAIETNNIFLVPHKIEKFDTIAGSALSGTFTTSASTSVTATSSQTGIVSVGCSLVFGADATSYVVSAISSSGLTITLASTYAGTPSSTATASINSRLYQTNFGRVTFASDGFDWFQL